MIVGVIGVTLALPTALHVLVTNAQTISGAWDDALDFSVFLADELDLAAAERLAALIGQRADVERVSVRRSISSPAIHCRTRCSSGPPA